MSFIERSDIPAEMRRKGMREAGEGEVYKANYELARAEVESLRQQLEGAVTALEAISAQDERGPATLREARMMARQALASLRGQ